MSRLVILGGGESGVGAAALGKRLGYELFLSDSGSLAEKYASELERLGVEYETGGHSEERILNADLVVKSPGIPEWAPIVVALRERGVKIISEIEFAGCHSAAGMICITGSNGKTTTTLLTHHLLASAGLDARLAGNVGRSLAAQVAEDLAIPKFYVVELSSFQLDGMFDFRADIAIITNITPDHLDRYDHSFDKYAAAKFRILQNMRPSDLFIYGADSEAVKERVERMEIVPEKAPFSYRDRNVSARMEGDMMVVEYGGKRFEIDKDRISIKGRHNLYNAMAATLAAMRVGLSSEQIAKGLESFPQVEHRLESVCEREGVLYINDSKATNIDSSWYALDSMTRPVVWIAGGTDKGNDYSILDELVRERVKVLVCMGVDNSKLIEHFSPIVRVEDSHSMEECVDLCRKLAEPGDVVLLSPCCASFDLFKNFEDRGERFKREVTK